MMNESLLRFETEVAKAAALLGKPCVVSDNHATFPCGDVFVWIKTKNAGITETAARAATINLPVRLRGILENAQAVALGDGEHRVHVHRKPKGVNDHDRLCSGRDSLFQLADVYVPGLRVAIN